MRHLGRLVDKRRIGRRIPRLILGNRLEVTGVGDDNGHLTQLIQQVHHRLLCGNSGGKRPDTTPIGLSEVPVASDGSRSSTCPRF